MIRDRKVAQARDGEPSPSGSSVAEHTDQSSNDHDGIGGDGHDETGAVQTGQQGEVDEDEGEGQAPVQPADPEDLTKDLDDGIGFLLVVMVHGVDVVGDALTGGHGEVGEEGDGCDQRHQDMEESFLLQAVASVTCVSIKLDGSVLYSPPLLWHPGYRKSTRRRA